jgi:signal peptidase II
MFSIRLFLMAIAAYALDQVTKWISVAQLGGPNGEITRESVPVIGEWFRFTLAYNYGSAFSIQPAKLLPWLTPTTFYVIITVLATLGLIWFLLKPLPKEDVWSKAGIYLILAGAYGNLTDRILIGKVIDFLDAEFPNLGSMERWPIFNLADTWVCIGIGLVLLGPWLTQKLMAKKQTTESSEQV